MNIKLFIFSLFLLLVFPLACSAVCPICSAAVAGGVGLSRWLGIDDIISGIWVGGLIISLSFWILDWLKTKRINFKFKRIVVLTSMYTITILPLYFMKLIGVPGCKNKIFGVDKLLIGILIGSLVFLAGMYFDLFLRRKNNNKVYFQFQKVIVPVLCLFIASLASYFLINC